MDPQEEEKQREGVLGSCPQVEVEVGGWKFLCLLDTGWLNVIQHCWGENRPPVQEQLGNACLTWRDPVQIPAHSEVVRWAQVSNGGLAEGQCGLVEGVEDGGEWKVAQGLVRVRGGRVLLRITNVYPFPIELPRWQWQLLELTPHSLFNELWSLLREILESRVIAESASLWAVPVVLMRKKDGAWRFCVDYWWDGKPTFCPR
ncbi:hypothetical protein SKAU_G00279460 [Synaphobranchus kaupii]|uniref:Uncharacterized protein n=1 Tax=Synaphobranchus kaupii TaxID=118154 RepID=A0A9Q1EWU8_SYNKA|nr:hypothetical protein SKAU_G00279460 [Synaphobranchus kaupii]